MRAHNPPPREIVDRWVADGWWDDRTLPDLFDAAVAANPQARLTIVSQQRPVELTLAEFDVIARRIASGFAALGIGRGDVVAVQSPNWLEGLATFTAALRLGAIVTPVVHIYGPSELDFILTQSRAKIIVTPDRFRKNDVRTTLRPILGGRPGVGWLVFGDADQDSQSLDALKDGPVWDQTCPAAPEDVALLIYTSGTTSSPKGVQHSHRTLGAEMRAWRASRPHSLSPSLCAWPVGHVAGFLAFLRFVIFGESTVFMDAWDGALAAELVEKHRVKATSGTPLHIGTMLDAAASAGRDLSSLIDYQAGATTIPASLVQRCESLGLHSYRCYGSSEHPTVSIGAPQDSIAKRLATDGRLAPAVELRLVDDDGDDVPPGSAGEIAVRGPDQFIGYRDARLDQDAFLPGGWFLSGDIGRLDEDGYLSITDRKKDVIIRGGENISSREVEDHLLAHPRIVEAAAVAMPDERLGERVCACVVLDGEASLELAELIDWFQTRGVARQKTPEHIVILDELPKNAAGKIVKSTLRERLPKAEATTA